MITLGEADLHPQGLERAGIDKLLPWESGLGRYDVGRTACSFQGWRRAPPEGWRSPTVALEAVDDP